MRDHRDPSIRSFLSHRGQSPLADLAVALLLLSSPLNGCSEPPAQVLIVNAYPQDGAVAIPSDMTGSITFNQEYPGDAGHIHASLVPQEGTPGAAETLQVALSEDRRAAQFKANLFPEGHYCLSVEVEAQPELDVVASQNTACFTTSYPCGLVVDVGKAAEIDVLGSLGSFGLTVLNETAQLAGNDLSIALILQDKKPGVAFPMTFTGLLSGFVGNEDGDLVIPELGVTSSMPGCTIDADGKGRCHSAETLIPLSSDGHSNTILVEEADLSWEKSFWVNGQLNFENTHLRGYATQASVTATLISFGEGYEFLADYMAYDLDLDGDGIYDALSLDFATSPIPLTLEGVACQ